MQKKKIRNSVLIKNYRYDSIVISMVIILTVINNTRGKKSRKLSTNSVTFIIECFDHNNTDIAIHSHTQNIMQNLCHF
jgi:hypothetical protein